jgi:hypothetical protein
VVPRLGAWLAATHLVIHSFVNVGSPTTLSSPVYGGFCEMQMLVAKRRARILEIPVNHRRRRGGVSKVSGTFKGTILATIRIAATFFRVAFSNDRNHSTVAQTS